MALKVLLLNQLSAALANVNDTFLQVMIDILLQDWLDTLRAASGIIFSSMLA